MLVYHQLPFNENNITLKNIFSMVFLTTSVNIIICDAFKKLKSLMSITLEISCAGIMDAQLLNQ